MKKNDSAPGHDGTIHVIIEELHLSDARIQHMLRTLARILVHKTLIEHGVKPDNQDQC